MTTVIIRLTFGKVPAPAKGSPPSVFGLQDTSGNVHPGTIKDEGTVFTCELRVNKPDVDPPVFSGPFTHGPPKARFLYLSWKRLGAASTPWIERVKIPLTAISSHLLAQALDTTGTLEADVTGRRPHQTTAIAWRTAPAK